MRYNRVILIKPMFRHSYYGNVHLMAGLAYVSEALNRAGIPNVVVDMGLGYDMVALENRIKEFKPDLIGITFLSFGFRDTFALITDIKKSFPNISIVVGGPFVSTLRAKVLQECPSIDYGVVLEGDHTIVELCRGDVPVPQIEGLLYRDSSGEVVYSGDRKLIEDLDSLGFATYSKYELERYPRLITVVTSRGCPYQCIYCPAPLAIGDRFRVRSPQSVVDEFDYWYKKGYRDFQIADDNFTLQKNRVAEICADLRRRGLKGLRIACGNGIRADRVDRDLLLEMKEVGFNYIAFGVEAGHNRLLKRLKKGESLEAIEQAIGDACEVGYKVTLFFLLGSPEETPADIEASVNLALRYPVYDARFYNLIPFPGTELYDWVVTNDYFVDHQTGYEYLNNASHWVNDPIFQTPEFPTEERKRLYKWANSVVGAHTEKIKKKFYRAEVAEKFRELGTPTMMSDQLAGLYVSQIFQRIFVQTGLTNMVRGLRTSSHT